MGTVSGHAARSWQALYRFHFILINSRHYTCKSIYYYVWNSLYDKEFNHLRIIMLQLTWEEDFFAAINIAIFNWLTVFKEWTRFSWRGYIFWDAKFWIYSPQRLAWRRDASNVDDVELTRSYNYKYDKYDITNRLTNMFMKLCLWTVLFIKKIRIYHVLDVTTSFQV